MKEKFFKTGEHWVWLNAGAVAIALMMVVGLLFLVAVNGMTHFWPSNIRQFEYVHGEEKEVALGEFVDEDVAHLEEGLVPQTLVRVGNRDVYGQDFRWFRDDGMAPSSVPTDAVVIERLEWGNMYGYIAAIHEDGKVVAESGDAAGMAAFTRLHRRASDLREQIRDIERGEIGDINHELEQLRLERRSLELKQALTPEQAQQIAAQEQALQAAFAEQQGQLEALYTALNRDVLTVRLADGRTRDLPFAKIVHLFQPNAMGFFEKVGHYFSKLWEFLSEDPRESNTEGGVFPAIFGTITMVLLMSVIVTPFGVIAAVYLSEYAKQGLVVRMIRIAVNNLAGVPSIVYGVFGLGFFVYFLGHHVDDAFFAEAKPSPTFGTPGLMWASLTLALLTLPVVIVSTEEGLSRIPKAIREGSLALGATKIETLWRTVLPMASPAMMTGLILAVARAAGEVAPLMLVGVVKLAPTLPIDLHAPFLHLDHKFMHLGFHIYDVGFQSPNVEAARPLVYASALLLVLVTIFLNIAAIKIRNRLREKYKALEH